MMRKNVNKDINNLEKGVHKSLMAACIINIDIRGEGAFRIEVSLRKFSSQFNTKWKVSERKSSYSYIPNIRKLQAKD
jgi:hypothetical protein